MSAWPSTPFKLPIDPRLKRTVAAPATVIAKPMFLELALVAKWPGTLVGQVNVAGSKSEAGGAR